MGGIGQALRLFGGERGLDTMLKSLNAFVFADPMFAEARGTRKDYADGDRTIP